MQAGDAEHGVVNAVAFQAAVAEDGRVLCGDGLPPAVAVRRFITAYAERCVWWRSVRGGQGAAEGTPVGERRNANGGMQVFS